MSCAVILGNGRAGALRPWFEQSDTDRVCDTYTTNCWGGWTRTLSPIDFQRGDLDPTWAWPIDAAEMHPYYAAALRYCSLGDFDPYDYDRPAAWVGKTSTPIAVLPEATGALRTGVFSVMNGQGPALDGALDFQHVWGPDLIRSQTVTLVRNANVRRLVTGGSSRTLTKIDAQTLNRSVNPVRPGNPFTVRARPVTPSAPIETGLSPTFCNRLARFVPDSLVSTHRGSDRSSRTRAADLLLHVSGCRSR